MKRAVYGAIVLLAILHQDFWFWNDAYLVFGFLPVGLAYHIVYSIAAAMVWYFAIGYAWPADAEEFARRNDAEGAPPE